MLGAGCTVRRRRVLLEGGLDMGCGRLGSERAAVGPAIGRRRSKLPNLGRPSPATFRLRMWMLEGGACSRAMEGTTGWASA